MSARDSSNDFEEQVQMYMRWPGNPPFVSSPAWEEAQRRKSMGGMGNPLRHRMTQQPWMGTLGAGMMGAGAGGHLGGAFGGKYGAIGGAALGGLLGALAQHYYGKPPGTGGP